jgi:hypothetical protein
LAPAGGTVWAASPARYSRPYCIGSQTKLRNCKMARALIWKYIRCTLGDRVEISAKPRSEWA